jgi:hypothetical protein
MNSRSPICGLVSPSATSATTVRSVGVRLSQPNCGRLRGPRTPRWTPDSRGDRSRRCQPRPRQAHLSREARPGRRAPDPHHGGKLRGSRPTVTGRQYDLRCAALGGRTRSCAVDAITSPLLARVAGRINEHVRHKKACSGDRRMRAALDCRLPGAWELGGRPHGRLCADRFSAVSAALSKIASMKRQNKRLAAMLAAVGLAAADAMIGSAGTARAGLKMGAAPHPPQQHGLRTRHLSPGRRLIGARVPVREQLHRQERHRPGEGVAQLLRHQPALESRVTYGQVTRVLL